jgi:hypothetical protein
MPRLSPCRSDEGSLPPGLRGCHRSRPEDGPDVRAMWAEILLAADGRPQAFKIEVCYGIFIGKAGVARHGKVTANEKAVPPCAFTTRLPLRIVNNGF